MGFDTIEINLVPIVYCFINKNVTISMKHILLQGFKSTDDHERLM